MVVRVLIAVAVVVMFLSGCGSVREAMNKEEQASTQAQTEAETETTAPTANDSADAAALSNEKKGWWIKRKENNEQSEAQNEIDLAKYDAFYVDTKNKDKKVMYLTFDCGYDNGYTEPMLDILKKHKAYAIFFVTQTYIRDNVEIVKRMKKEGSCIFIDSALRMGFLPVRNYRERFNPRAYNLDGKAMSDAYGVFPDSCQDCPLLCGRRKSTGSMLPSWKECVAFGSNIGLFSLESVSRVADAVRRDGLGVEDTGALLAYLTDGEADDRGAREESCDPHRRRHEAVEDPRG